jgi:hypothetical protein
MKTPTILAFLAISGAMYPVWAETGHIEATVWQIVPANDDGTCPEGTVVMYAEPDDRRVCVTQ